MIPCSISPWDWGSEPDHGDLLLIKSGHELNYYNPNPNPNPNPN